MRSSPQSPLWNDFFKLKKPSDSELIPFLREGYIFKTLTYRELKYLASFLYERNYDEKECIFKEGDRGFGMYFIVRGEIEIRTEFQREEVSIAKLQKGSFFGELSLVEQDNRRTAAAYATERTHLLGLFKPDLMEILERKPTVGVKLLFQLSAVLGQRLSDAILTLSEMKGQSGESTAA